MVAPQVQLAIRGRLNEVLQQFPKADARAVTAVIRNKGRQLQRNLRKELDREGLGNLANAVRLEFEPEKGTSLRAAHEITSKAIVRRPRGDADLLTVFDEGRTIRARPGSFLVIPLTGITGRRRRRRRPRWSRL